MSKNQEFPLISVLMPVYNVALFVSEAIESILKQSYVNLELIIVNDGSTDETGYIIDSFSRIDSRIKVYHFNENQKIVNALNFGLSMCKGDFIARMDGDDRCPPDRIKTMYEYLTNHNDISLVGCNMEIINESGQVVGRTKLIEDYDQLLCLLRFASPIPHIWLCKRSVYEIIGQYRLPGAEDYDFLLRMINKNLKFANIPHYLYQVRTRDGNTSTSIGYMQFSNARLAYKLYVERCRFQYEKTELNFSNIMNMSSSKIESVNNAFNFLRISILTLRSKKFFHGLYYLTRAILISPKTMLFVLYQRVGYRILLKKIKIV